MNNNRIRQRGSATLLLSLALMMSITILTLSTAENQVTEQRISSNNIWNQYLSIHAENGLEEGLVHLIRSADELQWIANPTTDDVYITHSVNSDDSQVSNELTFIRSHPTSDVILIKSDARRGNKLQQTISMHQYAQLVSILTPQGRSLPPLITARCINKLSGNIQIRPLDADTDTSGPAAWIAQAGCNTIPAFDTHGGKIINRAFQADLWHQVFSVTRKQFIEKIDAEKHVSASKRHYWLGEEANLSNGRWGMSLGNASKPVALYFPPEAGCPEFASGVRIFGVVFIDSNCSEPGLHLELELYGSLIINGALSPTSIRLDLNHIQVADSTQKYLSFPNLHAAWVPGTWRDF